MKKTIILFAIAAFAATSCSESNTEKVDTENVEVESSTSEEEVVTTEDESSTEDAESTEMESTEGEAENVGDASFEEEVSGLESEINNYINSESTEEKTFALTALSFDGELSEEGSVQLDKVAELLEANPNLIAEIQAHLPQKTGAKPKTAARALWIKTKLVVGRGVKAKQISAKGYGSDKLIEGLDPKDDAHKRLLISLKKQ